MKPRSIGRRRNPWKSRPAGRAYNSRLHRHVAEANERQLLVVMIESLKGLQNVEEIAAVPGIDVLHLGTADLTHAMGLTFGRENPEIGEAVDRVLEAAARHGAAVGLPTQDPDKVAYWSGRGVRYFEADTPDYLLRGVYSNVFSALRVRLEKPVNPARAVAT